MQKVKISSVSAAGFWRCGRFWPAAGVIVDPTELGEDVMRRLAAEPQLRITAADAAEAQSGLSDAALADALTAIIATLEADDFQKDGKPKLDVLKARLPDEARRITAALRDTIWAAASPAA